MMSEVLKIIFFLQLINFHYSLAVLQMDKSSGFDDIGTPIWKLAKLFNKYKKIPNVKKDYMQLE